MSGPFPALPISLGKKPWERGWRFELGTVKCIEDNLKGNENSFQLSRVRVTEDKNAVNARRKSRGNRFWLELALGPR